MISEFWITSRVGPENSRSSPRSMVMLATIETITAGSTAMTENRLTICTCSRAAARPRRRAWTICQTSWKMMPTRSRMVVASISRNERTTSDVGSIGVSPVSTRKVRKADNSAMTTANCASHFRKDDALGSATDVSNDAAVVSALVILARGVMELQIIRTPRTDAFISQCCRITTNRRRDPWLKYARNRDYPSGLRFHNTSFARFASYCTRLRANLTPAAIDLDVEIANLLPQRVAVETEQVGRADLVAAGRRQRRGQQRHLDLLQDAMIEAGRRHAVGKAREVRG